VSHAFRRCKSSVVAGDQSYVIYAQLNVDTIMNETPVGKTLNKAQSNILQFETSAPKSKAPQTQADHRMAKPKT
jgi:hypothetical protein